MKLIDRDKLYDAICRPSDLPEDVINVCDIRLAIINQPEVEAISIKDIKDFLRCEKIDSCDWRNCSECSQMKCISIRNLSDLIEWSKEKENERPNR
jgi:hypothetical protein